MTAKHVLSTVAALTAATFVGTASAQLVNGDGELYPAAQAIPMSPIPPGDGTGWNGTIATTGGNSGVEALTGGAPLQGLIRLAFGSTEVPFDGDADPETPDEPVITEDAILFQQTADVMAEGHMLSLNYFGIGKFNFETDGDAIASFFGYLNGSGDLVQVDTNISTDIIDDGDADPDVWTEVTHDYTVPAGSPLIGENLVVGFYAIPDFDSATPADNGAFGSVDLVTLSVAIPEPASLGLLGVGGLGLIRRRRA